MKLDRNINSDGRGKYALLLLRKLDEFEGPGAFAGIDPTILAAIATLEGFGLIDWGLTGTDREFFLIRLKDKYAAKALASYAAAAHSDGEAEYAGEVYEMATRAGEASPFCKRPD
jgi:hypothetical protein